MLYRIRDEENVLAVGVEEADSAQDALVKFLLERRADDDETVELQSDGSAVIWRGTRYSAEPVHDGDRPPASTT